MPSRRKIRVLVATTNSEVYRQLDTHDDVEYEVALYTGAIQELMKNAQLVIIDREDLVEQPSLTEMQLEQALADSGVRSTTGQDFLADPTRFFGEFVTNRAGKMLAFPKQYCIAFVSCSGGTGCTLLAMDTAQYYAKVRVDEKASSGEEPEDHPRHKETKAKAALFEVVYGTSAFVSLTGVEMPMIYKLATDGDEEPQKFKGVDMYPMDYENVRVLTTEHIGEYFRREVVGHGLTVIDSVWPHEQLMAVQEHVNLWVVVASADRSDSQANAEHLREALVTMLQQPLPGAEPAPGQSEPAPRMSEAEARERVWTLNNKVQPRRGEQPDNGYNLIIEYSSAADDLRGTMGRIVLEGVYAPLWKEETEAPSSGLFG